MGVLLPYTGRLATSGDNIEKALTFAVDDINANDGLDGEQVDLVFGDSHTDAVRGRQTAESLLKRGDLELIMGPELAALAQEVSALAESSETLVMLPGLTKPSIRSEGLPNVVTTSPSTAELGCALGTRMSRDGHQDILIIAEGDSFHFGLARAALQSFLNQGASYRHHAGRIVLLPHDSTTHDLRVFTVPPEGLYEDRVETRQTLAEVLSKDVASVMIAAFPDRASELIWQIEAEGKRVQYYLSPALNSPDLLSFLPDAVKPRLLGLGPVLDHESGFAQNFSDHWQGSDPLPEAWFYYDAMALALLGTASALQDPERPLREHVIDVSRPPGVLVRWNELDVGLDALKRGDSVNYHGLTSACDIDNSGQLQNGLFILRYWTIREGESIPEVFVNCRGLPD